MTNARNIALAELGRVSNDLLSRVQQVDGAILQHVLSSGQYEIGSPAASAATDSMFGPWTVDPLLSYVNLEFAGALEHADTLAKWGLSAARGERTPVYGPWSVARSAIEMLAIVVWLAEPSLEPRARAGRAFTLRRWEAEGQARLFGSQVVEVDEEATKIGLRKVSGKGRPVGFEEKRPSRTRLVEALFRLMPDDLNLYSLLSAASHGELWAVQMLGFPDEFREEIAPGYLLKKAPPAQYLAVAIKLVDHALQRAWDLTAAYRGW